MPIGDTTYPVPCSHPFLSALYLVFTFFLHFLLPFFVIHKFLLNLTLTFPIILYCAHFHPFPPFLYKSGPHLPFLYLFVFTFFYSSCCFCFFYVKFSFLYYLLFFYYFITSLLCLFCHLPSPGTLFEKFVCCA